MEVAAWLSITDTVPVETPKILENERMLDFGQGFYTTAVRQQADRWAERVAAKRKTSVRIITEYEFDSDTALRGLAVVSFESPDDAWLDFVYQNRLGKTPAIPYDVAKGPVANDQVYATVLLYEQGLISKQAAITELKIRPLYNQILFHTEKSLSYCRYIRHFEIGGTNG
ncbi:MAG: DUF3990 domain-containing protein [Firmicutes bacterium]|nr:DUF3990 domain-containing protein [Bacillota bacterium]